MSTAEVQRTKSEIKAWVDDLSDDHMLSMLAGLKSMANKNLVWDDLSDYQKSEINAGLDDIKNGRVMSSAEFWSRLRNG